MNLTQTNDPQIIADEKTLFYEISSTAHKIISDVGTAIFKLIFFLTII